MVTYANNTQATNDEHFNKKRGCIDVLFFYRILRKLYISLQQNDTEIAQHYTQIQPQFERDETYIENKLSTLYNDQNKCDDIITCVNNLTETKMQEIDATNNNKDKAEQDGYKLMIAATLSNEIRSPDTSFFSNKYLDCLRNAYYPKKRTQVSDTIGNRTQLWLVQIQRDLQNII